MLYPSSTSDHNRSTIIIFLPLLCYILLLHQTTTILNIQEKWGMLCYILLLHQTTTNHSNPRNARALCYILLLHQTTTVLPLTQWHSCCVISFFYIRPQLNKMASEIVLSCVISFFYIRPQLNDTELKILIRCVISFFYIRPQPI